MHLAAESHVDRSIDGPGDFISTNVTGTYTLLEAARAYWTAQGRPEAFRFHHISTDEVFGSLGPDRAVHRRHALRPAQPLFGLQGRLRPSGARLGETYGLPVVLTNCSNNYGPFHFPEKLIPVSS
jgi:dTDP-glucose 4,6-dehydratase